MVLLTLFTSKRASRHNDVHFFDASTSQGGRRMVCFVHFDSFWLWQVLRATTACNFSALIFPDGSAPTALAGLLFRPSGATNHCENTMFHDFLTFSRTCIFFPLTLSLLWASLFFYSFFFFSLLFPSLSFSDSSHLCFPSVHVVGRF